MTDHADISRRLALATNEVDQCRILDLNVGDTIEGREEYGDDWHESRLTLLWLGKEVVVWSETSRSRNKPEWSEPEESANWTLECRSWHKVPAAAAMAPEEAR